MKEGIRTIAFDADDTLWVNEPYFQETEKKFCELLEDYMTQHHVSQELFKIEMQNLPLYGYGAKAFMLSMIETVLYLTNHKADPKIIEKVIELGKELLQQPIVLLDGVKEVLEGLQGKYRLVVATKGDLLDQERKLAKSGIESFFHHVEVMSEKKVNDYKKLIRHLDCQPNEFLMIGNSLKSDILPVLELGAYAIHVPYHVTWAHEKVDIHIEDEKFSQVDSISEILKLI